MNRYLPGLRSSLILTIPASLSLSDYKPLHSSSCPNNSNDGSNDSVLDPFPFTATTGDLEIGIELSFRPSVTVVAFVGAAGSGGTVQLSVSLDGQSSTSRCSRSTMLLPTARRPKRPPHQIKSTRISSKSYHRSDSTPSRFSLKRLVYLAPRSTSNLSTTCYFFDAAKQTLGSVPSKKPANLSSAQSTHIPLSQYYMAVAVVALLMV